MTKRVGLGLQRRGVRRVLQQAGFLTACRANVAIYKLVKRGRVAYAVVEFADLTWQEELHKHYNTPPYWS